MLSANNIVQVQALPKEREVIRELADGTEVKEMRQPRPQLDQLKVRILEILATEGMALIAMNAALLCPRRRAILDLVKAQTT